MAKPSLFSTAVSTATSDSHCEPQRRSHQCVCDLDEFLAMSRPQCLQWWADRVGIENDAHPFQDWRSDKLRLHDRGMSDQAIPELFHRIPSSPPPSFPQSGPGRRLGQGDKPGDATVLPVLIGDREISGSLLATAERAHHPVGVERGKTPGRRQPWETPHTCKAIPHALPPHPGCNVKIFLLFIRERHVF